MADAGLFQLMLPKSVGGQELSPLEAFEVVERVSMADGSAGWCSMIATGVSLIAAWLPPEVLRDMASNPAGLRGAGSLRPNGKAWPVDGGYRMHRSYDFASGISHADWIYCPCFIMDGDDVAKNEAGAPDVGAMWIPADQAQVVDTWSVVGMRGTGSHDFIVEDVFVPESHTCFVGEAAQEKGPLYDRRMVVTSIFVMLAGMPLGIARGAINELIELATDQTTSGSSTLLRDRPAVQAKVGETEAILSSARAYVLSTAGAAWMAACDGKEDPSREIAGARLAVT